MRLFKNTKKEAELKIKLLRKERQQKFDNLKSICLTCKHNHIIEYKGNPLRYEYGDFLNMICKLEIGTINEYINLHCLKNYWYKKVTKCSDWETKK